MNTLLESKLIERRICHSVLLVHTQLGAHCSTFCPGTISCHSQTRITEINGGLCHFRRVKYSYQLNNNLYFIEWFFSLVNFGYVSGGREDEATGRAGVKLIRISHVHILYRNCMALFDQIIVGLYMLLIYVATHGCPAGLNNITLVRLLDFLEIYNLLVVSTQFMCS